MEKTIKTSEKKRILSVMEKPKRKSKYALWLEKNPNGIVEIIDLEAVLQ